MSNAGAIPAGDASPPPPSDPSAPFGSDRVAPVEEVAPRSWTAEVLASTVSRTGAKIGLIWIAIVAFCAIFAPLLANSYPLIAKVDGEVSFPVVRHFTAADVTLLIGVVIVAVLWVLPMRRKLTVWTGIGLITAVAVLSLIFVSPPATEIFESHREAVADGRVQWAVRAPVPYSVGDRQRDVPAFEVPHPWAPRLKHPMGTNTLGADILSHMIHACRIAMAIGVISTGISMVIGVIIGGLMGYFAGIVDLLGSRLIEIFAAIPTIYLLLTFIAAFPEYRSIYLIMAIIGLTSWTGDARFVRAEFLKLRKQDFVHAAIAAGLPLRSVLFRHLLPNALAPLLVSASFGVAGAILAESTLSFLGLGIPIGDASWGQLLNEAISAGGGFNWWLATFPGVAIFFTVFAYNMIGEAVRDALDPRMRGT
ncbi:MAG TPA: ABC transporter permease [Tepidisphaeraceae bacterium]|jgi:peptide/nickel transport system permease protein|nr:ABC transporter permease [Tepidisphaeraceae bacterium]